jgi:NADPH:quinone reductase-like Zn-dependent oxidoreductase
VGNGVQHWHGGERVISTFVTGWLDGAAPASSATLGVPGPGVLASHVLLDADWVTAAPATLDAAQASTLPCAALTAWFALVEEGGGLHAGQTVLIHGTGGVALFGLQFARLHGARVIMVSGSEDKRAQALALGAHHVLARESDWAVEVMRLTEGRGAEHVLETVGGPHISRSLQALARGGQVSVIGVLEGGTMPDFTFDAIGRRALIQGISVGHRAALDRMVRAIDVNGLVPVVAAEYGFDEAPKAFEHLARGAFGKVVVRM